MIAALYIATVIFFLAFGIQLIRLGLGMARADRGKNKNLAMLHLVTGGLLCILPICGLAFGHNLRVVLEIGVVVAAMNYIGRQFLSRSTPAAP